MRKEEIYMALIKCSECGKKISDKALACPNCGMPVSELQEVSVNTTEGNAVLHKKGVNKKIITFCAFIIALLACCLLIWIYGCSNYTLKESLGVDLNLSNDQLVLLNDVYSDLSKQLKIHKIFSGKLDDKMMDDVDKAFSLLNKRSDELISWMERYDEYEDPLYNDNLTITLDLSKPLYERTKYELHYYDSNDEYCKNCIKNMEQSLKEIKKKYCK